MCDPLSEGGRRCPSSRGERRRAYDRARYAALVVEGERAAAFSTAAPAPRPELSELAAMTRAERTAMAEAARSRYAARREAADAAYDALLADIRITDPEERRKIWTNPNNYNLGSYEGREAITEATRELGRDVSLAAEAEYLNAAEEAGLDDASVAQTYEKIVAEYQDRDAVVAAEASDRAREETGLDYGYSDFLYLLRKDGAKPYGQRTFTNDQVVNYALALADVPPRRRAKAFEHYRDIAEEHGPSRAIEAALDDVLEAKGLPFPRITDLDARRKQMWVDAQRAEIARVQSMGEKEWDGYTSSAGLTAAHRATFAEAVACFPDSMVTDVKGANPALNVRYTKKRAHFASRKATDYQTHEHVLMGVHSLDYDTADEYMVMQGSSPKDAARNGYLRDRFFHPATDEVRERLERIAEAHNEGRTETSIPGQVGRGGTRLPRRMVVAEVSHPETGEPALTIRSERKATSTQTRMAAELTTDGSLSTTVHEISHAMDRLPRAAMVTKHFLRRRTAGLEPVLYREATKAERRRGGGDEYTVPDGFSHWYMGKDYPGSPHTEVLSVGMEALFVPDRTPGFGAPRTLGQGARPVEREREPDYEHREIILGILTGYQQQYPGQGQPEGA